MGKTYAGGPPANDCPATGVGRAVGGSRHAVVVARRIAPKDGRAAGAGGIGDGRTVFTFETENMNYISSGGGVRLSRAPNLGGSQLSLPEMNW